MHQIDVCYMHLIAQLYISCKRRKIQLNIQEMIKPVYGIFSNSNLVPGMDLNTACISPDYIILIRYLVKNYPVADTLNTCMTAMAADAYST